MSNRTQNQLPRTNKVIAFIDYKPAELRKGKNWFIVYYAKNPLTKKLERLKLRAPLTGNTRQRELHANKIIVEINKKLANDWTPWHDNASQKFKHFRDAKEQYIKQVEKEIKFGDKREDTLRTYASFLNMIDLFIKEKSLKINFVLEFDSHFVVNYLDWVYYDRNNSPRTHNNHLIFLVGFFRFCVARGYMSRNPAEGIATKKVIKKKRQPLDDRSRKIIRNELPEYNIGYYILCMVEYYSLVRRTEMTKLKVADIKLRLNVINMRNDVSKNKSDETTSIPEELWDLLDLQIATAVDTDYVFSKDNFLPGPVPIKPKRISDYWATIRKKFSLPAELQWYDLKRTGITDLFNMGVSSWFIKNQARHKELRTTEGYATASQPGEVAIVKSGLKF